MNNINFMAHHLLRQVFILENYSKWNHEFLQTQKSFLFKKQICFFRAVTRGLSLI